MRITFFRILFSLILLFQFTNSYSQEKPASPAGRFTISGYVSEASTGESLLGANVYVKEGLQGTTTNAYGFYSITLPEGDYTLIISFIGSIEQQFNIKLNKDVSQDVSVENKPIETKEVTVVAEKEDKNVQG